MGPSWRTTLGGWLAAAGLAVTAALPFVHAPAWLVTVSLVLAAVGAAFNGQSGGDHKAMADGVAAASSKGPGA